MCTHAAALPLYSLRKIGNRAQDTLPLAQGTVQPSWDSHETHREPNCMRSLFTATYYYYYGACLRSEPEKRLSLAFLV